jgi:membrane associated rhomboid family serine protease
MARSTSRIAAIPLIVTVSILLASFSIAIVESGGLLSAVRQDTLVRYGALTAKTLSAGQLWRVLSSQLLHVYAVHGLLNAAAILWVGSLLQASAARSTAVVALLCGGIAGQLVALVVTPAGVVTGASNAAVSVCFAAALIALRSKNTEMLIPSVTYVLIAAALDLVAVGRLKSPHVVSALVGLVIGGAWLLRPKSSAAAA